MLSEVLFAEWPLVLFTVLAQGAGGISIIYAILRYTPSLAANLDKHALQRFSLVFVVVMAIALIFSILHLGTPMHGFYILTRLFYHVGGELQIGYLPLEIITLSLALLVAIIVYFLARSGRDAAAEKFALLLPLLSLVGIAFMAAIYGAMHDTVPAWSFGYDFISFLFVALTIGATRALTVFKNEDAKTLQTIALIAYLGFLVTFSLNLIRLGSIKIAGVHSIFDLAHGYYCTIALIALLLTAVPVALLTVLVLPTKNTLPSLATEVVCFASLVLGFMLFRVLFYSLINTHMFL